MNTSAFNNDPGTIDNDDNFNPEATHYSEPVRESLAMAENENEIKSQEKPEINKDKNVVIK